MIPEEYVKTSSARLHKPVTAEGPKSVRSSEHDFSKAEKIRYYREWIRDELYGSRYLAKLEELSEN